MNTVVFEKKIDKDFTILNLTDTQLGDGEWAEGALNRRILEHTVNELIERVKPDLITITGDLAWAGHDHAYDMVARLIDGFGVPWAPVWGNHDNQNGEEYIRGVAARYKAHPNCIYKDGPAELGNGNYVIKINDGGSVVCALIMLDTHDRARITNASGEEVDVWGKLRPCQIEWIESICEELKKEGCGDVVLFEHIPINAYQLASKAAYKEGLDLKAMSVAESLGGECWNEGYKDSIGVQHEGVGCHPIDEGALDMLKRVGIVSHIIAGHEHINNFIIKYEGIKMVYALKTGAGCYWEPLLNGGTVIKIGDGGVNEVYHEYVDPSEIK